MNRQTEGNSGTQDSVGVAVHHAHTIAVHHAQNFHHAGITLVIVAFVVLIVIASARLLD